MFGASALQWTLRPPFRARLITSQIFEVGVRSIPVVMVTGAFTGMVLALQTASAFRMFGAENMIASVVSMSMIRELGPVLTGVMVAGRAGSAMAAELGTMRVTQQIDAMHTLATNPVQYLVVPRIWAATLSLPCLVAFSVVVGIYGGRLIAVEMLELSPVAYAERAIEFVRPADLGVGALKASLFGFALALVGCYQGYRVSGGAREVGFAVNRAVVWAIALILMLNYLVTAFLF